MIKKEKKTKTIKIPFILSVILSIMIIILILVFTINANTFGYLSTITIGYEFFAAAVVLNILYWFLWGARLKVLSNAINTNVKISLWESTKIVIANLFLASITPSMAGGEPIRIHLLNKDGLNLGEATATVLGERLLDAIFLLMCVPAALFIFRNKIDIGLINTGLTIGIFVFVFGVILFLYAIKNPYKVKSFIIWLNQKIGILLGKKNTSKSIVNRINTEVDNFHDSMVFFIGKGKKSFLIAGLITILFWSTGFMIPSMLLLGLGLEPFVIESYAAQVLLIIIIMMPTTPGSSGIAEGGVAALYSVLIDPSHSYLLGVFVLLFRLITYHMNLIAGSIFQYRIFKSVTSFSLDIIKKE